MRDTAPIDRHYRPAWNDALGAQLACMLEYVRSVAGNMFVEKDAGLDAAQEPSKLAFADKERQIAQVLAIIANTVAP